MDECVYVLALDPCVVNTSTDNSDYTHPNQYMAKPTSTSLWRPGNALMALGILLLKLSARMPMSFLQFIGKALGSMVYYVFPFRKRVALVNLKLCFPELSEKERRRLAFRHYQSMGMGIFELAAAWFKPDKEIQAVGEIKGMEHVKAVEESGRGIVLLTAHFTTLEYYGRLFLINRSFSCLYRNPNQPILAREMTRIRKSRMYRVIHMDEINEFIKTLRDGRIVWYAPDQGKKIKFSEVLPFFGVPAVTNTATGRLARMGKSAILPFFGYRLPNGRYQLEVFPEVTDVPSGDPATDGILINKVIEKMIRKAPEQYFWLHKRFKRRGEGYPDVYKKDF
jgi:KDO2-lipid IV(A) lauroyltransferase